MAASSESSDVDQAVTAAPTESRPPTKISALRKVLPFVVATALLAFVASRIDFDAFVATLKSLDYVSFLSFAMAWQIALLGADALGNYAAYRLTMPSVRYTDFYVFRGASYLPGMVNHHIGQAYMTYLMSKLAKIPIARVAGATLVSYAGWMGCLLGCVALALPLAGLPLGYVPIILGAGVLYLVVIQLRPERLAKTTLLAPLFEAGLRGHAVSLVARLPHLLVLVLGTWCAYRFFAIEIPIGTALLYLPIVLVAATLPITPQGFGTRETLAAAFFGPFAKGASEAERLGRLTASTTAWGVAITLSGILIGLFCAHIVQKRLRSAE
ncbi:MAG: hypothetical protein HOW73_35510 [Polyangiaceae bacterium]|nr:hypothetical protein [Polyangiaceae bacterium]